MEAPGVWCARAVERGGLSKPGLRWEGTKADTQDAVLAGPPDRQNRWSYSRTAASPPAVTSIQGCAASDAKEYTGTLRLLRPTRSAVWSATSVLATEGARRGSVCRTVPSPLPDKKQPLSSASSAFTGPPCRWKARDARRARLCRRTWPSAPAVATEPRPRKQMSCKGAT